MPLLQIEICITFRAYIPSWLEEEAQNEAEAGNQLSFNKNETPISVQVDEDSMSREKHNDLQYKKFTGYITFRQINSKVLLVVFYLRGRLISTKGQTVQQVQGLY